MSLRSRLGRARNAISAQVLGVRSASTVDASTWNALEEALILADLGVSTTADVLTAVRQRADAEAVDESAIVLDLLRAEFVERLGAVDRSLARGGHPAVWLFVGVNGVGKTTTVGKLAHMEVQAGTSVVLAAGDTFRAAAVDQLALWGDKVGAPVVRGAEGADPSSVIFDAVEHAAAVGADLVLADTAGRVHTRGNLMDELSKVRRVAEKGAGTVTETLLVIDSTTGQNGLIQARRFTQAADVTGVVLTKLDGSARGGIVVAVQEELGIPVKMVGVGEGPDDLIEFDPVEFVDALFELDSDVEA
ncbi:MAG: signal recognition particle-docking protein FtsY [Acidimicrobiales bacterium]|jgi:fused signal recognition particle receptor|nr:signal recognition particle-docking protein FtsY [Actinomycetota bacterium]MDP6281406.1 signal recognition particle-docking protein FtsY [Acidimicrobiales bacterium]MDP7117240.1 signal recognition particle-docking protein FtsY [Acidimicrobiales bacterium]MDP7410837.1 signal recognition particle-docking protein FtsY [Acidimicrobiales bacterium]MEE1522343.1 signal recognition particle-docking protein FtsY [Acidimicrobiales bacterium]|tara:strand:+ start:2489 stop:3400 length:912 start_codon:yes stop_codon:yes gene_type:complete